MKLSDVVSAMHVSIFATLPLLIFLGIFVGVVIHLTLEKDKFEAMSRLPLDPRQEKGQ